MIHYRRNRRRARVISYDRAFLILQSRARRAI